MDSWFVSTGTLVTILIGLVISVAYLVTMARALKKVAATIDTPEPDGKDAFSYSFVGAIIAVVASSVAIIAYGLSPAMLYVGIILALLSPIAVTYTLYRELTE